MYAYRKNLAVFLVSIAATFACLTASANPSDADAAAKAMRDIWDKPEAPLVVEPVSVEGDYALAGWVQLERGGRALLRKMHGQWRVHVCGGDGLKDADALVMAGMTPDAARKLVAAASKAEEKLPDAQRRKFALFGQNIVVDPAHGAH